MLKTKKILSVLLSLIMIFSVFSIAASAATEIKSINIQVEKNIAGMDADDFEEYFSVLTSGVDYDYYEGSPLFYVWEKVDGEFEDFHGKFVAGKTYSFSVYLEEKTGYNITDDTRVYINGVECVASAAGEGIIVFPFRINVGKSVDFDSPVYDGISKAEVDFSTDIAGMKASDYKKYISILTEGLEFDESHGASAVYVTDSYGDEFTGKFVAGETYSVQVYMAPSDGYRLNTKVDCYVNGENVHSFSESIKPDGYDERIEYVAFDYDFTVEEKAPSFFELIIQFFLSLFSIFFGA